MKLASTPTFLLFILATAACGGSALLTPTGAMDGAPVPGTSISALDAAPGDAASPQGAEASPDGGDDTRDAVAPSPPDAAPDPCAIASTIAAHCTSLIGTTPIASTDVTACIDAMQLVRANTCFTDAQRTAFDETALEVLESALSLTPATCDSPHLQPSLQWIQRYVTTARALTQPSETVDHPKLVRLDDAFWRGVYWGDPRASKLDRTTLRTIRQDGIDCAHAALDAALPPLTPATALPLTTAPLVGVVGEALVTLGEAYDWTTIDHEFGCAFQPCNEAELPGANGTWRALSMLDDGVALGNLFSAGPGDTVWGDSLEAFAAQHVVFESAVLDALGATTYSPALLSDPSASDLPTFEALVSTRDHAHTLVAAYTTNGTYTLGPPNDLYGYAGMADYATAASNDLAAQSQSLSAAASVAYAAENAFYAGTQLSFDLAPLEAAQRTALVWAGGHIAPLLQLRFPNALTVVGLDNGVSDLAGAPDAPALYSLLSTGIEGFDAVANAFDNELDLAPSPLAERVAVSFPNPMHVSVAGEQPIPWKQVDATRAKFVWDAIASGATVTNVLQPDDLYSWSGGAAVVFCSQSALVLRAAGLLVEYDPSLLPPSATGGNDLGLALPFLAPAEQPYLTAAAQLVDFRTENIGTQSGVLPVELANELDGLNAAAPIFADGDAAGVSPLASLQIDFAALNKVIGGALTAPRSLTIVMSIDVAPLEQGPLTTVDACTAPGP